ncbi:MAG TPA: virulence-associated E family protein [Xanthobacteraceae bacterium]|jgi:predicted P-loop ATPase
MTDNVHPFPQIDVWLERVLRGDRGVILSNYHNACTVLEHHPGIRDALSFDDFAKKAFLTHHIGAPLHGYPEPEEITDKIIGEVQQWMQHLGMRSMSLDNCARALFNVAQNHRFHPVRDYLEALVWDGTNRNSKWLTTYLGAIDNTYTGNVGPLFLISMAARIFEPGCKVDYMLVFEQEQGRLKSTTCEVLFAPWFSDSLPDISASTKDASVHLRGKWGIEIAELHAFNRAETTHLKSFISRRVERYRPPYGRMEVEEPRQVVFIGTTNRETYLKDETGGRRFWPVKLGDVRIDDLIRDRDQIMAQAVVDYRRGVAWWPSAEIERDHIKQQQDARYDRDDAWADPIREFLGSRESVTFSAILDVLDYKTAKGEDPENRKTPINRIGKIEQNRIRSILIAEGWERAGRDPLTSRILWKKKLPRTSERSNVPLI